MRFATISVAFLWLLSTAGRLAFSADEPPTDWIDPATGHRVIRLSQDPGTASLYFHQNAYTDSGDKLFVTIASRPQGRDAHQSRESSRPKRRHRAAGSPVRPAHADCNVGNDRFDDARQMRRRRSTKWKPKAWLAASVVGKKTRSVYYTRTELVDGQRVTKAYATNLDTHATREIGTLPMAAGRNGSGLAINADETLLGGSYVDLPAVELGNGPSGATPPGQPAAQDQAKSDSNGTAPERIVESGFGPNAEGSEDRRAQEGRIARRLAQHLPMKLYTINIQSGEVKTFNPSTDWENHVQFSPTDPTLMMFCHEGTWQDVDRIWTIRVPDGQPRLMHPRSMKNEIAGHEFFGHDGKWIWYDLQTPRSGQFWLGGVNLETGERLRYPIDRVNWSVHYNESHDGKLFAGDGGGPNSVANHSTYPENKLLDPPGNGQWIYLFRPQPSNETMKVGDETVKIGKFTAERLVDLSKHDYESGAEPNVFARQQVDYFPFEYAWSDACLCGGGGEGGMKERGEDRGARDEGRVN